MKRVVGPHDREEVPSVGAGEGGIPSLGPAGASPHARADEPEGLLTEELEARLTPNGGPPPPSRQVGWGC